MNRRQVTLTLFLLTPFLALGLIIWGIAKLRPLMNAPPVGAGAGSTAGANAIGEYIAHGTTTPKKEPPAPAPKPKVDTRPIEAARTVYPRGTLSSISVKAPPNSPTEMADIQVFTPPFYDGPRLPGMSYPVLYIIGDKVFDPEGWKADDTASELMSKGLVEPAVIVALPLPYYHQPLGKLSRSEDETEYAEWLVKEAAPKVAAAYRLKQGAESTGIGGAEDGAWVAHETLGAHPDTFGLLLMQSPSGREVMFSTAPNPAAKYPQREYIGLETGSLMDQLGMGDPARADGRGADRLLVVRDPAGQAGVATWRSRLPFALAFLFPPPVDSTK